MSNSTSGMTPEGVRLLQNVSAFWSDRMQRVRSDAALAQACFDRARAAARRAQRGGDARAMHELAEMLATWAQRYEDREARRRGRDTA